MSSLLSLENTLFPFSGPPCEYSTPSSSLTCGYLALSYIAMPLVISLCTFSILTFLFAFLSPDLPCCFLCLLPALLFLFRAWVGKGTSPFVWRLHCGSLCRKSSHGKSQSCSGIAVAASIHRESTCPSFVLYHNPGHAESTRMQATGVFWNCLNAKMTFVRRQALFSFC